MKEQQNSPPRSLGSLLFSRRFAPLFLTQALGAFNDNVYKTALVVLITFDVAFSGSLPPALMVTAAGGIFILPFFLFSALAGQLGDRVDKAGMIRWVKLLEIIVMLLALPGFLLESADYLMLVLFLMGTQSAFFGPLKYGILPEHLSTAELPAGNAWIEAATFLAILGGTVLANLLVLEKGGTILIAGLVITLAVLGNVTALAIPKAPPVPPSNPLPALQWNIFKGTAALVSMIRKEGRLFGYILGISWFWAVGATFLTQFPTYTKAVLHGNEDVFTLLLCSFSVGIALGSLICGRIMRGRMTLKPVILGALGMIVAIADLVWASNHFCSQSEHRMDIGLFLSNWQNLRVVFDLVAIAAFGGLYVVPLYAILQRESPKHQRAQAIACTNIMNALFMVLASVAALGLQALGLNTTDLFGMLALGTLFALFQGWKLNREVA